MIRHHRRPLFVVLGERMNVMLEFAAPLIADHEPFHTLFTPFVRGDEMDVQTLFGPHARHIRKIEFRASSMSASFPAPLTDSTSPCQIRGQSSTLPAVQRSSSSLRRFRQRLRSKRWIRRS